MENTSNLIPAYLLMCNSVTDEWFKYLNSRLLRAFSCLHEFYVKMETFMSSLKDLLVSS